MRAEEILKMIRELPEAERNKVLMGVMKDFNHEMMVNDDFKKHAIDAMHRFMEHRKESGENISEFEEIIK